MAKQVIQLGVIPSGAGGDTPRSANIKINDNFSELYSAIEGLGSAAKANITVGADDATPGRLLKVGDRGIGQYLTERRPASVLDERRNYGGFDFSYSGAATDIPAGMTAASVLTMSYSNAFSNQLMIDYNSNTMWIRSTANGPWSGYAKVYTTANTTRAADGTLKAI